MAEIWKPIPHDTLKYYLQCILDEASDDLNAWELKFISDMEIRLTNGWELSRAQQEKLEKIYAEKTS